MRSEELGVSPCGAVKDDQKKVCTQMSSEAIVFLIRCMGRIQRRAIILKMTGWGKDTVCYDRIDLSIAKRFAKNHGF